MKNHDGCIRGFTVLSQSWYGPANLRGSDEIQDEIMIGMYHPDGGTTGEFGIRWIKLGGKYSPRLEVFDDSWHALWQFADLLERLPDFDGEDPEPSRIMALLLQLGVKDLTDRRPRDTTKELPLCRCCKQPIQPESEV
jgi:hypothetical protein